MDESEQPLSAGQIFNKIHDSNGMKFLNQLHARSFSLNILQMNAVALIEAVLHARDPDRGLSLMSEENREAGNQAHRELSRHLHNFAASVMTLVEHTRAFMREHYKGTTALTDYESDAAQTFASDPVSQFVQGLRNYMVHKGLPDSQMFLHFKKGTDDYATLETGFRIPTAPLLKWRKWNGVAKQYLSAAGETLDIRAFVEEYLTRVNRFHAGLEEALRRYHSSDLAEMESLRLLYQESSKRDEQTSAERPQGASAPSAAVDSVSAEGTLKSEIGSYVDALSASLAAKITELRFQASENGFPSEQHISATIFGNDMLEPPVFQGADENGCWALAFIFVDGKTYGFKEPNTLEIENVIDAGLEHPWTRARLSREFIEKAFLDWSRLQYDGATNTTFAEKVLTAAADGVGNFEVWMPIAHLEVESSFAFGPLTVSPISRQMVSHLEEIALAPHPEQADQISGLFQKIREQMQGLAAVVVELEAERQFAEDYALLLARDAVDLLRFFSPGARFISILCPTALLGAAHIQGSKVLVLRDGNLSSMTEKTTSMGNIAHWRLSAADLPSLQKFGLSLAGRLVIADGLDDFESAVRSSLITFSKGATFSDPIDRLGHTLTAIEGILLKHSMEPIEFNVADRMSFLLSQDADEREAITQNVRQVYRLRTHHRATSLASRELAELATFVERGYAVLVDALANINNFRTRVDFIAAVDRLAERRAEESK